MKSNALPAQQVGWASESMMFDRNAGMYDVGIGLPFAQIWYRPSGIDRRFTEMQRAFVAETFTIGFEIPKGDWSLRIVKLFSFFHRAGTTEASVNRKTRRKEARALR
jgi:hypothetical protein